MWLKNVKCKVFMYSLAIKWIEQWSHCTVSTNRSAIHTFCKSSYVLYMFLYPFLVASYSLDTQIKS